jgi:type II secretory pathway component PulF
MSSGNSRDSVKLEQFLALNDEIAALIRAGIPLELGLSQIAGSATGGLARLSERLSERMQAGATLERALADEGERVPGVYLAIVEAGLRSGRLPEALETISGLARKLLDLHRRAVVAFVYPLIVFAMSYCLFVAFVWGFVWKVEDVYQTLRFEPGAAMNVLTWLRHGLWLWGPGVPIVVILGATALTKASAASVSGSAGRLVESRLHAFRWLPWLRPISENYDQATFAHMLALLVKQETPLHEAIVLAGYSTGNPQIVASSVQASEKLQAGQPLDVALQHATGLPSFLRWMMLSGEQNSALPATMQQASEVYERRADHRIEWARVTLPMILTAGIGGTSAALYAVALFAPVLEMYRQLAAPII